MNLKQRADAVAVLAAKHMAHDLKISGRHVCEAGFKLVSGACDECGALAKDGCRRRGGTPIAQMERAAPDMAQLIADQAAAIESLSADAARYRWILDRYTYAYGDGREEPLERGISIDWQQGPWIRDGSNGGHGRPDSFGTWDAFIDRAIEAQRVADAADDAEAAAINAAPETSNG